MSQYRVQVAPWFFDLHSLTVELDAAFRVLYGQSGPGGIRDWVAFQGPVEAFLDLHGSDNAKLNDFFSNFTGIWGLLDSRGQLLNANGVWERALDSVAKWERRTGKQAHKGAGFYFWGSNAILTGDLQRGFMLIHQAVLEDGGPSGPMLPDTPAVALATLNAWKDDQPAPMRIWLKDLVAFLSPIFARARTPLSVESFRARFLAGCTDLSQPFLLVHTLAAIKRLAEHPSEYRSNDFAGQLALNLFFNLALVIERAVADKNAADPKGTFKRQADFLSRSYGGSLHTAIPPHPMGETKTWEINESTRTADFEQTLKALLDGTFAFSDKSKPTYEEAAIGVAYCLRNRGGHQTAAAPVVWERFDDLLTHMIRALCLCVEVLYL